MISYRGGERAWDRPGTEVVFGRTEGRSAAFLDLSPDQKVSRVHGRIWEEGGLYWIEDLNSTRGTRLNGVEIKAGEKMQFRPGDLIVAGETTLRVESSQLHDSVKQTNYLENGTVLLPETRRAPSAVAIAENLSMAENVSANSLGAVRMTGLGEEGARRLKIICELPLQFAGKTQLEALLRTIVDRMVEVIPNAESWGLVLRDPKSDSLLLKAYHAAGSCSVSETLARQAVETRKAFIWRRSLAGDLQGTLLEGPIAAGMYAPLLWQDEALGVLCANGHQAEAVFTEDDLQLMVVVAQYAAMAVATHELQEKLRRESAVKANLMRQFSPAVAERLLGHRGRLKLGGERTEVTLLCSDIRGFTKMSSDMEPDDIVETLNDYFAYLVPVIFANHGTIDKYMGDGILAVFGSPEPDPAHHERAVRAALEMQASMVRLNAARSARGAPTREVGIGIHCGEVVQGFVGTSDRMEFTVIGDAVNRAHRYGDAAHGKDVLISPEVHEHVWRLVEAEEITIPTKHEGDLRAYRVTSLKTDPEHRSASSWSARR
jgi:adenylate cyclase